VHIRREKPFKTLDQHFKEFQKTIVQVCGIDTYLNSKLIAHFILRTTAIQGDMSMEAQS
jgi:hypothetical protein